MIFVAHSLGGLVVEQALLISRGTSQLHVKTLLSSTFAIAFMGTPHLGSRKADWAASLTRLSSLLRKTNREIVAVLEPASEMLSTLQQEFHTMLEDRRRNEGKWIEIFCFYEELSYAGIGDIVPRQSAILREYPNASIHQNHSDMTKFSGATDPGYVRVRGQLWLWVDAVSKRELSTTATSPGQADCDEGTLVSRSDRSEQASDVPDGMGVSELEGSGERQPARREDGVQGIGSSRTDAVLSGGGPIFMGNISAGRDFSYTQRSS